jgi:hypothetical protein
MFLPGKLFPPSLTNTSLIRKFASDEVKMFYNIDTWSALTTLVTLSDAPVFGVTQWNVFSGAISG